MHTLSSYDYAVLRIVPSVEREEFFNAGVILFSAPKRFLGTRVHLDLAKLVALSADLQACEVSDRLNAIVQICAGDASAGPISQLSQRARFHWLVAPRSTWLQVSAVHAGLCEDPEATLERLFAVHVGVTP